LRQITAIDAKANTITIDIPTRYTVKVRDNARVYKKPQTITEVGVEGFSIGNVQHPGSGGWAEGDCEKPGASAGDVAGCFAIVFSGVRNGWIQNVATFLPPENTAGCHILNNGILLEQCQNVTVRNAYFQRPQYGGAGGAGYMYRVQNSGDCLIENCTAQSSRHGFVLSHMAASGNVLHACLDKTTGRQTGSTGNERTSGSCSDHHMHFSHSNLIDTCVADDSAFVAFYRPYGTAPKHNLTSAHSVFWNTEGRGTRSFVVQSDQSRYGYVVGTRGEVTVVKADATPKTLPADHVEGVAMGDTLTPFSLFLEQRRRRLKLRDIEPNPLPGSRLSVDQ
jgi:parallel beta-helix repeat protein